MQQILMTGVSTADLIIMQYTRYNIT
jgi:hypothetical protein